jgi:pyruvate dehydrogenase E2 component (dihydrolipoamide acetyltransferase)
MYIIKYPEKGRFSPKGVVSLWQKKENDIVKKGDILLNIEASGEVLEVESAVEGHLLKILEGVGRVVKTGQRLAILGMPGENISSVVGAASDKSAIVEPEKPQIKSPAKVEIAAPVQSNKPIEIKKEVSMTSNTNTPVSSGSVVPVLMPQAGQSMEEGTILSWKVKEGDRIEAGQIIMEIETDKATMEVEAVDAGRIAKIVAQAGTIVPVKVPVAFLAEEGVNIDAYLGSAGAAPAESPKQAAEAPAAAAPKSSAPATPKAASVVSDAGRVKASPAARKAAEAKGVSLASIGAGSGPGGRIISTDVENADAIPTETVVRPLSGMRKAIAKNLSHSKQTIPHFYATITINATELFATYRKTKEQFKCSVNDFVVRACAKAIRQYPAFRSQFTANGIVENPSVNIGVAVSIEDGLTVPVLLNADRMNLQQSSEKTRQIAESARKGKIEGLGQGVFTITNLGMFGVESFSAIINPPESAILAVGAIREDVIVENGAMRAGRLMSMTLSADHRVIDGALGAQFLQTLKGLLESPEQLV